MGVHQGEPEPARFSRSPSAVSEGHNRAHGTGKLEAIVWQELGASPQLETLEAFLAEFPDCKHTVDAKALRDTLKAGAAAVVAEEERRKREREAWATASAADNQEAYATFLKAWPGSQHTRAGRSRLKKLAAAAPAAGVTKRRKWLAAVFAVLVLPCQLLLGLLVYQLELGGGSE